MPIDHSSCTHPRTPAGRRACRAGRPQVSTPNPLVRTAPTPRKPKRDEIDLDTYVSPAMIKACEVYAERIADVPEDERDWNSSDGIRRNRGIVPPWFAGMKGTKGSMKNKRREIKKDTSFSDPSNRSTTDIDAVSRSTLPVTTPGIYKHPTSGVEYRVLIGDKSGKPFALEITDDNPRGEYAKGIIFELRACDKIAVDIPGLDMTIPVTARLEMKPGFYELDSQIYKVKISRSTDRPYALLITADAPRGVMVPNMIRKLIENGKPLTVETAAEFGFATTTCCICGRHLDNPESVARGIGPICWGKMGW